MSISYKKEFDTYEDGMVEISTYLPDLRNYIGNNFDQREVIRNMLHLIEDDMPFIDNDNYPNTFSFTISAREVGFKTDEGLAFGWRVWLDKNTNHIIGYQFRITFINLSRTRKKIAERLVANGWKEKTDSLQSKFWDENSGTNRISNEKENNIQEEIISTNESINVQDIPMENDEKDYSSITLLPTFVQDDENTVEDTNEEKEEVKQQPQPIAEETQAPPINRPKLNMGMFRDREQNIEDVSYITEELEEIEEEVPQPRPRPLIRGLNRRQVVQQEDVEPIHEVEDINSMAESQTLLEEPKQTILPNGKITSSSRNIVEQENNGFIELDPKLYSIRPGETRAEVIIKFEGEEFPVNVHEQTRGILRDPANKKLIINSVVYDYNTFTVFGLPSNYEPDQAIHLKNDYMSDDKVIPDEAFVPMETIRRNEDIDIGSIQEEAIKRENFKTRMTGIRPNITWARESVTVNTDGSTTLKQGRGFVISDKPAKPYTVDVPQYQTQSVQIQDDGSRFKFRR